MKPKTFDAPLANTQIRRRLLGGAAAAAGVGAGLLAMPVAAHGSNVGRVVNVLDYLIANIGGYTPGVTDCTSALRTLFTSSSYDVFYFPAGKYLLTGAAQSNAALARNNLTLIMVGDGPQASEIIWQPSSDDTSSHLIKWSASDTGAENNARLEIRNITLKAGKNLGTAIHGTRSAPAGRARSQVTIENVEVTGAGTVAGGTFKTFLRGIYLSGLEHLRIRNFFAECNLTNNSTGIEITSDSTTPATDAHLHHVTVANFQFGVVFTSYQQGLMLTDSLISGCNYGVYTPLGDGSVSYPGVFVRGCHLACHQTAVSVQSAVQVFICDNLIYLLGGYPYDYYVGIHCGDTVQSGADKDIHVRGNMIFKLDSPANLAGSFGVLAGGSNSNDSVLITDNSFVALGVAVWLTPNSNGAFVSHTNRYRACGTNVDDDGSGNTLQ